MKTIGEILKLSGDFLKNRRTAEEILAYALKLKRLDLYLQFDKPLLQSELNCIREMVKRCAKQEPVEYVTGHVDFYGCQIKVDPRVLIPRPETEILVDKIAKIAKNGILWDLCTGSGCIGIALKKANPGLQVTLSDISADALDVARENARLNGVDVRILQGDLLQPFEGEKADFIVCNPPYVTEEEYDRLDPSVRDFEPKLALIGGTTFYERLKRVLPIHLTQAGRVFFEIGSMQADCLRKLFPGSTIETDWANHPRFLFAKM